MICDSERRNQEQEQPQRKHVFFSLFLLAEDDDLSSSRACIDGVFSVTTSHGAVDKRVRDGVVGAVSGEAEGGVCSAEDAEESICVAEVGDIKVTCFHDVNVDCGGDALWRKVKETEGDFAVACRDHGTVLFAEPGDFHVGQVHGRALVMGLEIEGLVDLERGLPDGRDVSPPSLDAERDKAKLVVEGDVCRFGDHLELAAPVVRDGQGDLCGGT